MRNQTSTVAGQTAPAVFPIQKYWPERNFPPQLRSIPWALIQQHEKQAIDNHCGQTLKRLAERGGLCPMEAIAVLDDTGYIERWGWSKDSDETAEKQLTAIQILGERVKLFLSEHKTKSDNASGSPKSDSITSTPSSSTREGAAT